MKQFLALALFIFASAISYAQNPLLAFGRPPNSIQATANALMQDPDLTNASMTFYCFDVDSMKMVAEIRPQTSLVPASIQKVITTATALEMLGPGYRVSTRIQYTGYIDSMCVLHGDIYIKGGGDPALGGKRFKKRYGNFMEDWADAVMQLGIDSIDGRVIGDATSFSPENVPATWIWGDLGNYYGAGPNGLSIYDNKVVYEFQTGPNKGDTAHLICTYPYMPFANIINLVKASNTKTDDAYIIGGPYDQTRIIKGAIPKGKESFTVRGAMPDPALQAAFDLESELFARGVRVANRATTIRAMHVNNEFVDTLERNEVFKTRSPALSSLVHHTNMYSVNLFAEHILNWISLKRYGRGSTNSGTNAVTQFWKKKGIDTRGMYINDGSGLSRFNAVSAKQMVDILVYMRKRSKSWKTFNKSLPLAGKSGTLIRLCKGSNSYNNLRAKSGTMTRVKSFAGYVKTKSGRRLAFAVIVNNFNCSTTKVQKKLEKLLNAMGDYTQ